MANILIGVVEQGLIFGIMALGVYISYSILDFPDLTVDGTFPLGAAVTVALISANFNPWLCLIFAFIAGAIAGSITGFLHVKLKIEDLLSGILMMTALYSINYRIVGAPNKFFMGGNTIFKSFSTTSPLLSVKNLIILLIIAILVKTLLDLYLSTKSGFLLKSVGDNPRLIVTIAQNPGKVKIIGLAIANGLVAVSGAIYCQSNELFDITCGTGTIVMGLAAVIIGTTIFKKVKFLKVTTAVFFGMVVYKLCITLAIMLGLQSSDMNLVITVLFVLTLVVNRTFSKGERKI